MIELSPPPKFSGTDKVIFSNWWRQVIQFLDSQPAGAIGDDKRKISWVSTGLEAEAETWYWDWKEQAEKPLSSVDYTYLGTLPKRHQKTAQRRERRRTGMERTAPTLYVTVCAIH
jgi:hypothetical protein